MDKSRKIHMLFMGKDRIDGLPRRRIIYYPDVLACMILEYYIELQKPMDALLTMDTEEITRVITDFVKSRLNSTITGNKMVTNNIYTEVHQEIKNYYKLYKA